MARFFFAIATLLVCGKLAAQTPDANPWLDSSQVDTAPVIFVDGIVTGLMNVTPDSIATLDVVKNKDYHPSLGCLFPNGCIYITTKSQPRVGTITARKYLNEHKPPKGIKSLAYMVNGIMVPDTLQVAQSSIQSIALLLGSDTKGAPANSACLSIWTVDPLEKKWHGDHKGIRIRGSGPLMTQRMVL